MPSNLARDVAALERERDKLLMALEAIVNITSGNWKERVNAINVLYEVTHENLDYTASKKQNDDIRSDLVNHRGASNLD